jgi:hypothetical protein
MSKVSEDIGMLFGAVQSTVFSVILSRTIYVSFGERPVDSGLVHVARAPHLLTTACPCSTAALISSALGRSARFELLDDNSSSISALISLMKHLTVLCVFVFVHMHSFADFFCAVTAT